VLFLGDSFTFGQFVDDGETLPEQVGRKLGVEVVNAGVGGTTIVDQRVFLERALVVHPDVVVIVFHENDLNDLLEDVPQYERLARNRELKSGPLAPAFALLRDTALFHALMELRALWIRRAAPQESVVAVRGDDEAPAWVERMAGAYAEHMRDIRELLRERGVPLVVAAYPHPFSVDGDRKGLPDRIGPVKRNLAALGIPMLDLTLPLRASGRRLEEIYLLPKDGHASPLGYTIAADALAPEVARALAERGD
jgi:lysophospholipase L1-like esterase